MRRLAAGLGQRERRLRRGLTLVALLFALVAMLQPLGRERVGSIEQAGVDIVICLDVSRSMLARDLEPNRLLAAQREIRALAERIEGDRLALVAFAGNARLTVPMTRDRDSFVSLLELTDPLSVGRGGTDLGVALETALQALEGETGDHEVILLLTDGEDHGGSGLQVAESTVDRNIQVHCIGFGSPQGGKIPLEGPGGQTFLRDGAGQEVISAMDPASLRKIAEATGGEFVEARSRPLPLLDLYKRRIQTMERKAFLSEERKERRNYFQWPLLLACTVWIAELCLTDRRKR